VLEAMSVRRIVRAAAAQVRAGVRSYAAAAARLVCGHLGSPGVRSVSGLSVLLIDDGDTRDFLADTLRHYDASVTAVASVREALPVLDRGCPDVLVSNCDMSEADASRLIHRIRVLEAARGRRVPTIAVAPVARMTPLALGFHIRMPRPLDPHALIAVVRRLALADRAG
jgi:CheY-like chemotaxis protein